MPGYDENFLKVKIPLPKPSPKLKKTYLKMPTLRNGFYRDYINYTVATDKQRRAPIYAALNIDRTLLRVTSGRSFRADTRIPKEFQLNNQYYKNRKIDSKIIKNPYDKGHLAMRENATWGISKAKAKLANHDTFYYTNASLQHENFNRDEWVALEMWVGDLELALDGKISSFSGPIYGTFDRSVTPPGLKPAEVPAGFFKVIFFINKDSKKLEVRAFISMQDEEAIADRGGRKIYNAQNYQVTVKEIAERTGLNFKNAIAETNPLKHKDTVTRRRDLNISHFPERIEVDSSDEILSDPNTRRTIDAEDDIDVYIAAAMVNPKGFDKNKEWISILNLSDKSINLSAWTLEAWPSHKVKHDRKHKSIKLSDVLKKSNRTLSQGESIVVKPLSPIRLVNMGGTIALYDSKKRQIDRVKYTKKDTKKAGQPVILFERQADR